MAVTKCFHWLLAGYLILSSSLSYASISVSDLVVNLSGNSLSKNISIHNNGTTTEYVEINPLLVEHPGKENEKKAAIKNPRELGLLITPKKLVIPPGQSRTVRMVSTKQPTDVDRIYRLKVTPTTGKLITPKGITKSQIGLKLIIGYNLLVIVRPLKEKHDLKIARQGELVTVVNLGNTNVKLENGVQCSQPKVCVKLAVPNKRLYAGNTWQFKVKEDHPVKFETYYDAQRSLLQSN